MGVQSKGDIKRFSNQKSVELNTVIKSIDHERKQSLRDYDFKMHRFKLKYQRTLQLNSNNKKKQILPRRQTMDCVLEAKGSDLSNSGSQENDRNCRRHSIECASLPNGSGNTTMKKVFTGRHLITSNSTDQSMLPSVKETTRITDSSAEQTTSTVTKWPDIHKISKMQGYTSEDHPKFGNFLHGCRAVSRRNSEPVVHEYSSDQKKEAKRRLSEDVSSNTVEYKQFDFARKENNWTSNKHNKLSVACDKQTVVTSSARDLINKTIPRATEKQTTSEHGVELNIDHKKMDLSNGHKRVLSQCKSTSTNDAKENFDKDTTKKRGSPAVKVGKWELFGKLNSVKTKTNTKVRYSHNKNEISVELEGSKPTPTVSVKEESGEETTKTESSPVKESKCELLRTVVKTETNNKVTDSHNKNRISVKPEGSKPTPTIAVKEEFGKETTKKGSSPVKVSKWELLKKLNSVKTETNIKVTDPNNKNRISVKPEGKSLSIFDLSLKLYPKLQNMIIEEEDENSECDESNVGIFLTSASELRSQSYLRQQEVTTMKNLIKLRRGYQRTELVARLLEAENRASVPVLVDGWQENLSKCRYLR